MVAKTTASLALATSVGLAAAAVAYSNGAAGYLLTLKGLIVVFAVSLPFMVLWVAAMSAKGKAVPKGALALFLAFILLDAAVYFLVWLPATGSTRSIVLALMACLEMIASLLMLVGAVVSRARWEQDGSDKDQAKSI